MCDITLYTNTQVQGVPKEDRKDQKKKILKEIMAKNFPNPDKENEYPDPGSSKDSKYNELEEIPRCIIIII